MMQMANAINIDCNLQPNINCTPHPDDHELGSPNSFQPLRKVYQCTNIYFIKVATYTIACKVSDVLSSKLVSKNHPNHHPIYLFLISSVQLALLASLSSSQSPASAVLLWMLVTAPSCGTKMATYLHQSIDYSPRV